MSGSASGVQKTDALRSAEAGQLPQENADRNTTGRFTGFTEEPCARCLERDKADAAAVEHFERPTSLHSDAHQSRIDDLTRSLFQSRTRATEFSKSLRDMKASFVAAQNHFSIC